MTTTTPFTGTRFKITVASKNITKATTITTATSTITVTYVSITTPTITKTISKQHQNN